MHLRVLAVGTRMPGWVDAAWADYARRLRGAMAPELIELATAARADPARAVADEGRRLLARIEAADHVVALDERGESFSTVAFAQWLQARQQAGADVVFVLGGPDGLAPEVIGRANRRWSLSALTLPHGLARVVLAEQLYRAVSLLSHHPYHRA